MHCYIIINGTRECSSALARVYYYVFGFVAMQNCYGFGVISAICHIIYSINILVHEYDVQGHVLVGAIRRFRRPNAPEKK